MEIYMKFDYSYYKNTYGGLLDENDFSRLCPAACDVISLLIGRDAENEETDAVLRALCLEVDYISRLSEHDPRITKETLGDYSASYAESPSGAGVSPEALAALTRAGYLTRWS